MSAFAAERQFLTTRLLLQGRRIVSAFDPPVRADALVAIAVGVAVASGGLITSASCAMSHVLHDLQHPQRGQFVRRSATD